MTRQADRLAGFTLIEVMVALVIIALVVGSAVQAASVATDGAISARERTCALWTAQNALAIRRAMGSTGEGHGKEQMCGMTIYWRIAAGDHGAAVEAYTDPEGGRVLARLAASAREGGEP